MSEETVSRDHVVAVVQAFIDGMGSGNWEQPEKVLAAVADDASWWIAGGPPLGGTFTKQDIMERYRPLSERFDGGLDLTPRYWTVEGNRAAVEFDGKMKFVDGSGYGNKYNFVFTVTGDQISEIREYWDTGAGPKK